MIILRKFKQILRSLESIQCVRLNSTVERCEHNSTLTEKTLTGRMITYLNYNKGQIPLTKSLKLLKSVQINPKLSEKINLQELRSCIQLFNAPHNPNLLLAIDRECCRRITEMSAQEICDLLHAFVQSLPDRIIRLNFYQYAINTLRNNIDDLNKDELIQLMFFAGLLKKHRDVHEILRNCFAKLHPYLHQLDSSQLCIICNSFFKTSTKANENLLTFITHYLNRNLNILTDAALFVTFVKIIRQNKYQNEELLTNISCTIFFNKTSKFYSLTAIVHILALYADYSYYDDKLFPYFVKLFFEQFNGRVRLKDINTLLWSLGAINYQNLDKKQIDLLIEKILKNINSVEHQRNPEFLIEIVLSLWILNYKAYQLLPFIGNTQELLRIQDSVSPTKQRLNLLLTLLRCENSNLYEELGAEPSRVNTYPVESQIKSRPVLQRVRHSLKLIAKNNDVNRFELGCQIPHLNIVGITGYKKKIYKTLHIEVLDNYTSVQNTESLPSGLMQTKLKLLDNMEEGLITVDSNEISEMTEYELQQYLEDSINLVT